MIIYAIIPARSGSRGLLDKNIKQISKKPLLAYSIEFAKKLKINRIFCSTDSKKYAKIAIKYGAEVPFLRSKKASSSSAMEQDILKDLYYNFEKENIPQPDIIVWLRPTFVFRNLKDVLKCIDLLKNDSYYTSARTICEAESRLYKLDNKILTSTFEDGGKSMIRRQDIISKYKVFSTDVFRSNERNISDNFLGDRVAGVITNKLCGLDIDDELDFRIVENLLNNNQKLINENT